MFSPSKLSTLLACMETYQRTILVDGGEKSWTKRIEFDVDSWRNRKEEDSELARKWYSERWRDSLLVVGGGDEGQQMYRTFPQVDILSPPPASTLCVTRDSHPSDAVESQVLHSFFFLSSAVQRKIVFSSWDFIILTDNLVMLSLLNYASSRY